VVVAALGATVLSGGPAAAQAVSGGRDQAGFVQEIHDEYGLTAEEQLVLAPLVNEIAAYSAAKLELQRQAIDHGNTLEQKIKHMQSARKAILDHSSLSIRQEVVFRRYLHSLRADRAPELIYDPSESVKSAFTPPESPWGWVRLDTLPELKRQMEAGNEKLSSRWRAGEMSFMFTWPGFDRLTIYGLREAILREDGELRKLRTNLGQDDFTTPFPHLGWVQRKGLKTFSREATERLVETRDRMRRGEVSLKTGSQPGQIFLAAPRRAHFGDLYGWVTREQVTARIAELEAKRAEVVQQFRQRTLKIYRKHVGWTTREELDRSMKQVLARAGEVSDSVKAGDYLVEFLGVGRSYTRRQIDLEIEKTQRKIEEIKRNDEYRVPVLGFGALSRRQILQKQKNPKLTPVQRASLQRGLQHLPRARSLEIAYYSAWVRRWDRMKTAAVGTWVTLGPGFAVQRNPVAAPLLEFCLWDSQEREKVKVGFARERTRYLRYYDVRIDHLRRCLAQL